MAKISKQGRSSSGGVVAVKSGAKKLTHDASRKTYVIAAETGRYRIKDESGRTVAVRNASTGQFVLAPAVKASKSFRSRKATVVSEVISKRRGK